MDVMICKLCKLPRQGMAGPDPCWGFLPGVVAACCGHGIKAGGIAFENGVDLQFDRGILTCSKDGHSAYLPHGQLEQRVGVWEQGEGC